MSRTAARCTQADINRAIKAADKAGSGRVVEIAPDGTIRIVPAPELSPQVTEPVEPPPLAPEEDFRL